MKKTMKSVMGLLALSLIGQSAQATGWKAQAPRAAPKVETGYTSFDGFKASKKWEMPIAFPLIVLYGSVPIATERIQMPRVSADKKVARHLKRIEQRLDAILKELRESRPVCPKTEGASSTEKDTPGDIVDARSDK